MSKDEPVSVNTVLLVAKFEEQLSSGAIRKSDVFDTESAMLACFESLLDRSQNMEETAISAIYNLLVAYIQKARSPANPGQNSSAK